MAKPSYLDIIRQYPVPTATQTREFAEYVAGAHSWYKHLPVYPPVPFCFYLDPNAGRSMVFSETGEMGFEDIVDESTRFRYTWQLTETYRKRLGYWNYFAPYGTFFQIPRGQGVIDTRQSGYTEDSPAILVPEMGWITVPDVLIQAGTAGVTAMVHKRHDVEAYWAVETEGGTSKRLHLIEFVERHSDALSADARVGMVKWVTFWNDPTFQKLQETDINAACEKGRNFKLSEVFPLLDRERERQIAGMEAAMQRFLAML